MKYEITVRKKIMNHEINMVFNKEQLLFQYNSYKKFNNSIMTIRDYIDMVIYKEIKERL